MPRPLNLRQIEAFKAVMEYGTVSRAAEMLNISQPAMSKLVAHLEADTGLELFDRLKGRLAPTENAMRLHEEVDRIFAGMRQIESAAEAIRREQQGKLTIGVMAALGGSFIQRVTTGFLKKRPEVLCTIKPMSSQWIVERLVTKTLDVGLVSAVIDNPYVVLEPIIENPLVCIMPPNHPLTKKTSVLPDDLNNVAFVSFDTPSYAGSVTDDVLLSHGLKTNTVLVAGAATTVCEFVAAGLGVSLVHPLMVAGYEERIAVRPFEPSVLYKFQIGRNLESRNAKLIKAFIEEVKGKAIEISESIIASSKQ
jgi:DNA-binding transcriptional LysR family regulator